MHGKSYHPVHQRDCVGLVDYENVSDRTHGCDGVHTLLKRMIIPRPGPLDLTCQGQATSKHKQQRLLTHRSVQLPISASSSASASDRTIQESYHATPLLPSSIHK